MKLISKHLEKDRSGRVTLCPEDQEDMWHVYNLIHQNDQLRAITFRRVQTVSNTGSTDSQRIKLKLSIRVETTEFDASTCSCRVNGRVIEENEHVKMGAYHTIDIELHRNIDILKPEWDSITLERVQTACDITKKAEIAAIVMQEGLANVCLLTENITIVRQRIEVSISRKRKGNSSQYEKSTEKFHDQLYQALIRHVDLGMVKVVIIASPGFYKDSFYKYLMQEAVRTGFKGIQENKSKFLLLHSSSGHKSALEEILKDPSVQSQLAETKFAKESKALNSFFETLNDNPNKAFYGLNHVEKALELGAISTLLLSDDLFRSEDVKKRRRYIEIVERVKAFGGQVYIFSSLHTSGERMMNS